VSFVALLLLVNGFTLVLKVLFEVLGVAFEGGPLIVILLEERG